MGDLARSKRAFHIQSKPKMLTGVAGAFKVALVLSKNSASRLQLKWEVEVEQPFYEFTQMISNSVWMSLALQFLVVLWACSK